MYCSSCGVQYAAGANFCSACGARLSSPNSASHAAARSPDASTAPLPQIEPTDAIGRQPTADRPNANAARVLDAGDKLLVSGSRSIDVEAALAAYLARGAKLVTPLCQVGNAWAAACTIPPRTQSLEETQSLKLADAKGAATKGPEPEDGCRIEELGFKRIVYGPSPVALKIRLEHMKQFGAEVISEIEEIDGEWVAVCDVGSAKNTGYRW